MNDRQTMINQVNGIINFLSVKDKEKLPKKLIKFFHENSNIAPEYVIDPSINLKEQNLSDETLLILEYISKFL